MNKFKLFAVFCVTIAFIVLPVIYGIKFVFSWVFILAMFCVAGIAIFYIACLALIVILYALLGLLWFWCNVKLWLHDKPTESFSKFMERP